MTKTAVPVSALVFGLAFAGLVQAAACGARGDAGKVSAEKSSGGAKGERLASGAWGGEHARMEVSDAGATVEFDCAHGSIEQPVVLDSEGGFDLKATFVAERGGRGRDATPPTRPARYAGRVSGDTLTLKVTLTDTGADAGTYTLTRGSEGRLFKCR